MATNYAQIIGIHNKWAPIVFAVIYALVMVWYSVQAIRRHGWVYGFLALFSALRVVSFSLRAAMANNHHNAAFNRQMAIAYEVLYNIGFFSILLSAHRLLNDRRRLAKIDRAGSRLHQSMSRFHKGRFIELLLLTSVILGAIGVAFALGTNTGRTDVGNKLGQASTYIFLATTVFIVLLTFLGIHIERALRRKSTGASTGGGSALSGATNHHHLILLIIAALLLLRILFYAATIHQRATGQPTPASQAASSIKQTAQGNEHLWYPLAALAELLAVLFFLTPALVPVRSLVNRHRRGQAYPNEKGPTGTGYNTGDTAATGGLGAADNAHNGLSAV
ncbi:hypothetical protein C8F04DRAFT_1123212 [Mycena alexandri]|uniref:DUF7702 domain-containing protein n=1 Tax=Mycena alexandri TaxID=1745969 RepID=A0AAD6WVU2_9AGAR|nr:hypothetical protein C8F04DRAFT_1123212 [Mycena alexandri]